MKDSAILLSPAPTDPQKQPFQEKSQNVLWQFPFIRCRDLP